LKGRPDNGLEDGIWIDEKEIAGFVTGRVLSKTTPSPFVSIKVKRSVSGIPGVIGLTLRDMQGGRPSFPQMEIPSLLFSHKSSGPFTGLEGLR